jgi:CheY-like chemotaxis protein
MTPGFSVSLRTKLLGVVLITTLVALAVALCAMIAYDLRLFQSKSVAELETQAELLGRASAPALQFDDPNVAQENLQLLRFRPEIQAAAIYEGLVPLGEPADDAARRPTLLYVEDNPANLKLVEEMIRLRSGLQLLSAPDARLGIELARVHRPRVILMDIHLPGMNGEDALKILREDQKTAHIPVIAITANAMPRDVEKGLASGFFRYLTKPLVLDAFTEALDSALQAASGRPARGDPSE